MPKAVALCSLDNHALRRVLISVASLYGSSADVHFDSLFTSMSSFVLYKSIWTMSCSL